jgi:hypothetical protein
MAGKNYDLFMKKLGGELDKIWHNEPSDLKNLKKRAGHGGLHASPTIDAEFEAFVLSNQLWGLREVQKGEKNDLETLKEVAKTLIGFSAKRYNSYFTMPFTKQLLEEATETVDEIQTRVEFKQFISQLMLYAGRLYWWTHGLVPWYEVSVAFERATKR